VVVGVREGTLYRLQGNPIQALVHDSDNLCELWALFKTLTFQSNKCIPIYNKEQKNKYIVHNIFTCKSKWKKTTKCFSYIITRLH
jgi:hypothetical protein